MEEERDRLARGVWNWSESETRRFLLAGGGLESDFAGVFARAMAACERIAAGLERGTYHAVSGGAFFPHRWSQERGLNLLASRQG